jgi:hypothetical protein
LGAGAAAGIAVGAIVVLGAIIGAAVILFLRRRRQRSNTTAFSGSSEHPDEMDHLNPKPKSYADAPPGIEMGPVELGAVSHPVELAAGHAVRMETQGSQLAPIEMPVPASWDREMTR